ncbi:MAG: AarF/UbiB family protein, partial [Parachlamydia sp.]|nr:AarF/UbiB family protein [Parachlamydia sp.]
MMIEELGQEPKKIYKNFNEEALSAASIGQIHLAELANGKKVAVKVQRSEVKKEIGGLLEAIGNLCRFFEHKTDWGRRYHI